MNDTKDIECFGDWTIQLNFLCDNLPCLHKKACKKATAVNLKERMGEEE